MLLVLLAAVTASCSIAATSDSTDATRPLRLGVLPSDTAAHIQSSYEPIVRLLEADLGRSVELVVPASYDALVDQFAANDLDLAVFGGLTYLVAHERSDAQPLVMRDIDTEFITAFVARIEEARSSVEDYEGMSIMFGSDLSTSGHLMPRHFLEVATSETPEAFFSSVMYSGSHDQTVLGVLNGDADLGAVDLQVLNEMIDTGRVDAGDLSIVWTTPPYVDYVWASQPELSPAVKDQIVASLISLSVSEESTSAVLEPLGAAGFFPASDEDFGLLREIATRLDLLSGGS